MMSIVIANREPTRMHIKNKHQRSTQKQSKQINSDNNNSSNEKEEDRRIILMVERFEIAFESSWKQFGRK